MKKQQNKIEEGNVVEEFTLGETKVKICDDYCKDKTPEEVKKILDEIAQNVLNNLGKKG